MDTRILGHDAATGVTEFFHWNDADGTFTIERQQDVSPIITLAQAEAGMDNGSWKGDWHKVASIPMSIYMDLEKQGIARDPARMKRWLNDRDNQVFRTKAGTV
jgi:hypothetical protein